jgi:predicted adenylyl cyclase CyaB
MQKTRKKYSVDGFEIVIDDIKDYGIFVEIEIDHQIENVQIGLENIYELLRTIGITTFKKQIGGCGKMEMLSL